MGDFEKKSEPNYLRIKCGHCKNEVHAKEVAKFDQVKEYEDQKSGVIWDAGPIWLLMLCAACGSVNLCKINWHSGRDEYSAPQICFPAQDPPIIGLPESIETAYEQAKSIRSMSPQAYVVMLGRLIEEVCIDRGANGRTLFARLQALAENGEIPEKLLEVANALREFRNVGAHAGLGDLSTEDTPIVEALCKAILEYVYSAPKMLAQAYETLEKVRRR
ncbi:MAG: DUF4145 domain-containing protein [Deltaproteobacteria bacterium]|nr:DUF4145 domain-containing protein [Deltaproteobacteria bacterium]